MDPITHTLTGLALSRAGLNRLTVHALPVLLLAANAPDIDIVTAPGGAATYLHYHRHITHAFLLTPVIAILPVLMVRLFARKPFDWKWAYIVSLLGVASHPLLDLLNTYGIRLLLPFSSHWFRLDTTSLPDIWMWAVLLLAAVAPFISRLVSSEIGARRSAGRGWAIFALVFLVVYTFGRWVLHERALAVLDSRLYQGRPPSRVAALPSSINPFGWTGLVDTPEFYSVNHVNLLGDFDPGAGRVYYKQELNAAQTAAANAARQTEAFKVFLDFSAYPYWRFTPVEGLENGIRVQAMDLRFCIPERPRFVATAIVDQHGRVVDSWYSYEGVDRRQR